MDKSLFPPPPPYTDDESAVAMQLMWRHGRELAIPLRELQRITGLGERAIKEAVQGLRLRHCEPVGSRRQPPGGYYIIDSAAELEETCRALIHQAIEELRVVHMLRGKNGSKLRELLGQLELEIGDH